MRDADYDTIYDTIMSNMERAIFRIPKICIDGKWYLDIDIADALYKHAAISAVLNKRVSCSDFDKVHDRVKDKLRSKHEYRSRN